MDRWVGAWVDGWMDGSMDGWAEMGWMEDSLKQCTKYRNSFLKLWGSLSTINP